MSVSNRLATRQTLLEALEELPREAPFVTMWRPGQEPEHETATFGEFLDNSRRFATIYRESGLSPEGRVILIQPQGISLMAAFVGAMLVGGVPTILAYPNFKIDPVKYQTGLAGVSRNIGAGLVVVDGGFPENLLGHVAGSPQTRVLQIGDADLRSAQALSPSFRPRPEQVAFLQHSAGTTGLQKGVALSHRVVLSQLRKLAAALQLRQSDRIASWLPLYHDMGLIACFVLPLVAGLRVIMQSPVDWVMEPVSFLRLITRFRCTLSWIPNFTFQFLARRVPTRQREDIDLSSMRAFVTTSEPIRAHSLAEFREAYAGAGLGENAIQTSYGMAENVFAVTQSALDRPPRVVWVDREILRREGRARPLAPEDPQAISFVSCGRCMESIQAWTVDEGGQPLPEGRVGEVVVESDCLFDGYFNRPDLTRKALKAGRYHTGDIGFLLGEDLFVIGRKDDTIIVGGRNLYPQDIEEIAFAHPDIHDGRAVAFGLENRELGTEDLVVVAEVHRSDQMEQRQSIAMEIRRSIVAEMGVAPRFVHVVPPHWLVKSTAGKPARSTNREKFLKETRGGGL